MEQASDGSRTIRGWKAGSATDASSSRAEAHGKPGGGKWVVGDSLADASSREGEQGIYADASVLQDRSPDASHTNGGHSTGI